MGGALIRVTEPEACEDADGLLRCRVLLVARTRVATSLRSCNEKRELCVALLFVPNVSSGPKCLISKFWANDCRRLRVNNPAHGASLFWRSVSAITFFSCAAC